MAFYLPIKEVLGSGPLSGVTVYYAPLNVNERLDVIDADGVTPIEAMNVPDTTATLGGKLKVVLADGTTVVPVAYRGSGSTPPTVTYGAMVPGERGQGSVGRRSEVAS